MVDVENDAPIAGNQQNDSLHANGNAEHSADTGAKTPPTPIGEIVPGNVRLQSDVPEPVAEKSGGVVPVPPASPTPAQSFDTMPQGVVLPNIPQNKEPNQPTSEEAALELNASLQTNTVATPPAPPTKETAMPAPSARITHENIAAESGVEAPPPPFSFKDMPVGPATTPKTPPILRAMDMLNRGNAIAETQKINEQKPPAPIPAPKSTPPIESARPQTVTVLSTTPPPATPLGIRGIAKSTIISTAPATPIIPGGSAVPVVEIAGRPAVIPADTPAVKTKTPTKQGLKDTTGTLLATLRGKTRNTELESAINDEKRIETPLERNLRESGLREALPRQERPAPERAELLTPDNGLPRIHTYAEDMGREIQKRGATIASIVTAERARAPVSDEPVQEQPRHVNLFVIGAVVLLILGVGAIGSTAYYLVTRSATVSTAQPAAPLIPVNSRGAVTYQPGDSLTLKLAAARSSASLNLGEIEELDVTENGMPMSATDILTALGAPNALARNAVSVMVGLHAYDHIQPFLIIRVAAYDLTFQAMLNWEQTVGANLGNFFAPASVAANAVAAHPPALSFTDTTIANLSVRTSQSAWPILYAFPQQNLLIITTNEGTLREILTRLSLQSSGG